MDVRENSRPGSPLPTELAMEQDQVQDLCLFCKKDVDDVVKFGHKIQHEDVTVHYFCMLFASGLCQNGECETDGIKGFLPKDIKLEVSRGKRLKCIYCEEKGATVGCVVLKCRKVFHYPCGYDHGMLNQYFGSFQTFCEEHRPTQAVPMRDRLAFKGTANTTCLICMCNVEARASNSTLRAPCCKNSWFHRSCIQRMATCSGVHFFKCPLCNNKEIFQNEMLEHGIYIPDQDAAWELEPNAFQELLQRHCRCDVKTCQSVKGRQYNKDNSKWEIMLCDWCGSQGTHLTCSSLKTPMDDWVCADCQKIVGKGFKKAKKKIMSPEEKALPKEWLEFKNKSEYPGKTKPLRKTKKQLNFSTIKIKPGQKLYPGISDVRVVLKDCKHTPGIKAAKETKRRYSTPAVTCTATSSSATTEESSPDKKRRKLQRVNGDAEEIGPVDLTNRPNWYKELMTEDIITGANLGRQLSSFPKELGINQSMESETNINEACGDIEMNGNAEGMDCEIAFSKPVINERRRWLQEQSDDTTYDIDLSSKPRWYQELMSTDIITGKNLGANFAEVHEKLDVIQNASPQISPLKPVQSKDNSGKIFDLPPPLQTEVLQNEITPMPVIQGRKVSKYCQRDGSSFSPSLVPDKIAKKGRELQMLLREDIVTGNNLGTKFSDIHTSLVPIPILSPVRPSEQEITNEVDLADSCPPKLKRFDEPDTDSGSEPENALDKTDLSENLGNTSLNKDVQATSLSEDFHETSSSGEIQETSLTKDVHEANLFKNEQKTDLSKDVQDVNLSKDVNESSLSKDVIQENANSEIKPFSGNRFYRRATPKSTPKKNKSDSVEEKGGKIKAIDKHKAVDTVKSDLKGTPSKRQKSSRKERNIFSQIEKEFLPLEDLMSIGEESGCDILQPKLVDENKQPNTQSPVLLQLDSIDRGGKENSKSSATIDQMSAVEDLETFTSDALTQHDNENMGAAVDKLQSLEPETMRDRQVSARENLESGQDIGTKQAAENQVLIDASIPLKRRRGRPKMKGLPKRIPFHAMKTRFSGFNYIPKIRQIVKKQPGNGKRGRGRPSKPISQEEELLAKELQAKHELKTQKMMGRPVVHGKFSIFSGANEQFKARYFRYMAMRILQKRKAKEENKDVGDLENNPESSVEELEESMKENTSGESIEDLENMKEEPSKQRGRKDKQWRMKLKSEQCEPTDTVKKMGRPVVHGKYSIFNGDEKYKARYYRYAVIRKMHRERKRQESLVKRKLGRPRKNAVDNMQEVCKTELSDKAVEMNEGESIKKKPGRPRKYSVEPNTKNSCEGPVSGNGKETEGHHEELVKNKLGRPRKWSLENTLQNQPSVKGKETDGDSQVLPQKKLGRPRKHSSGKDKKEKDRKSPESSKENLSTKKQIKITNFFNQSPESAPPPVLHERKHLSFNATGSSTKSQPEYIDLEDLFDISPLKSPQRFNGNENEETLEQKSLKVEKECMKQLYSDATNLSSPETVCHAPTVQKKLTSFVNVYKRNENNPNEDQNTSNISNHDEIRPIAMISPMKFKEGHLSEQTDSPSRKRHSIMQHAKNFFFNKLVTGFNTKENSSEIDKPISDIERNNNVQHVRIQDGLVMLKEN